EGRLHRATRDRPRTTKKARTTPDGERSSLEQEGTAHTRRRTAPSTGARSNRPQPTANEPPHHDAHNGRRPTNRRTTTPTTDNQTAAPASPAPDPGTRTRVAWWRRPGVRGNGPGTSEPLQPTSYASAPSGAPAQSRRHVSWAAHAAAQKDASTAPLA